MIIFGLLLIIVVLPIILKLLELNTKKIERILLNFILVAIAFIYIVLSFVLKIEPFIFNITSVGDYFINLAIIFIFSPFLWIVLYYYCRKLFRNIRYHKNSKIKSNNEYIYYRDDLDKISPSIVMFTSIMDIDVKKSIAATILKLKLIGYIKEVNNQLKRTDKNDNELLEIEKMVLNSIKHNSLDGKLYKKLTLEETLKGKYIRKNTGGKVLKIIKILVTILLPIVLIISSIKFDEFVFEKYQIYDLNNTKYIKIDNEKAIEYLNNNEIKNINDYYHRNIEVNGKEETLYSYDLIRADKYEYSIVRIYVILNILDPLLLLISITMIFVAIFMIIEQIRYFNKNYIRTFKGNELLNKAYALKNYLKEFSLIKDRTEKELVLWEYYLIYAVILDVNVKIEDEIMQKYFKNGFRIL